MSEKNLQKIVSPWNRIKKSMERSKESQSGVKSAKTGLEEMIAALNGKTDIVHRISLDAYDPHGLVIRHKSWVLQLTSHQTIVTSFTQDGNYTSLTITPPKDEENGPATYLFYACEDASHYETEIRRGRLLKNAQKVNALVTQLVYLPDEVFFPPTAQHLTWMTPYGEEMPTQPSPRRINEAQALERKSSEPPSPNDPVIFPTAAQLGLPSLSSIQQNASAEDVAVIHAGTTFPDEIEDIPTQPMPRPYLNLPGLIDPASLPPWLENRYETMDASQLFNLEGRKTLKEVSESLSKPSDTPHPLETPLLQPSGDEDKEKIPEAEAAASSSQKRRNRTLSQAELPYKQPDKTP